MPAFKTARLMLDPQDQLARAERFRAAHAQTFVMPNPWDAGSARLLELAGFQALGTTRAGFAFSQARPDNGVTREALMRHIEALAAATLLPLSADLENGFGATPADVADTIRLAARAGVVGGSIEDSSGDAQQPLLDIEHAAERVQAAVEAARSLPFPFTLTARAENFFVGDRDLRDTVKRLQRYQEAGADVLFAPGLTRAEDIATIVREVDRPVSVMAGFVGFTLSVADLAALGVRRVSTGASLARAAYGEFLRAARELHDQGTTDYAARAVPGGELNRAFASRAA